MTARAVLYFGGATTPRLLKAGSGYRDDDARYELLSYSRRIAPAGAQVDCIFTMLHLSTVHFADDVSWWISVAVDAAAVTVQRLDLLGVADSTGEEATHSFGLSVPYLVKGRERIRTAPRGTWFELRLETKYADQEAGSALEAAQQIVASATVEYQPCARRSRSAPRVAAAAPTGGRIP